MAAPTRIAADADPFRLADFALGGHFLARLNRNLREEHGWTYGIYSNWERDEANARWGASCIVSADDVAEALGELQAEITKVGADGATAAEIDAGWRDALSGWNTALRTAESAVGLARGLVLSGDSAVDRRERLDGLRAVTPDQSRAAAAAWLTAAHAQWVVVGDPDDLAPELAALPWPITRVSAADAVVGTFSPPGHTP
jgi:predicted Zn-dependent peptidase